MSLRAARAALFAVIPAELLFVVLAFSGVALPAPLVTVAEMVVAVVLLLEAVVVCRLFWGVRRTGAGYREAWCEVRDRLVPRQVVRLIGFDLKGTHSLVLWVLRRRSGVPRDAVEVSYAREESFVMLLWLFAMAVEAAGVELLLRGLGAPHWLRVPILVIDVYGILLGLAVYAAYVTRPHVVTEDELRIRYGAFFDLRIPRERITSVRLARKRDEEGVIKVVDGTLVAAVSSQTNLVVELDEPVTVIRPLGRRAEAGTIRFFADTPEPALAALRPSARSAA